MEPRALTIYNFEIANSNLPEIEFNVNCSKGTYIRSLAHDFGEKLGVGGYLKKLIRTSIGDYKLSDAMELDDFIRQHNESN